VRLGPHLNFIGGHGGYGKSSIMNAIQICLGLSAKDTDRAMRLVDLIRCGAPEGTPAVVEVRLSNEGEDAFDSRKFGKSIVIERTISPKSPISTFRIMTHEKRVVSTEKSLVKKICDRFHLNMRNPMSALDQNLAKEFMWGKKETLYRFFLEVVGLQKRPQSDDVEAMKDWLKMRKTFSTQIKDGFTELCLSCGMDAMLTFDHESESLGFKVVMNAEQTHEMILASQVEDANQLCGGERSRLASILMYSMWKVTKTPVHMMDEPAIFMDIRNRRHFAKLLFESAQKCYRRQVILLSPLDYTRVFDDDLISRSRRFSSRSRRLVQESSVTGVASTNFNFLKVSHRSTIDDVCNFWTYGHKDRMANRFALLHSLRTHLRNAGRTTLEHGTIESSASRTYRTRDSSNTRYLGCCIARFF